MPGKKDRDTLLSDQDFLFTPDPQDLSMSEQMVSETDLDIVANTYRAIVDQHAFDAMIASWQDRLDATEAGSGIRSSLSKALLSQIAAARKTMEALDIPVENDPIGRAVQDVPGPAVVLSPDGHVAAINRSGAAAFGCRQGMRLDVGCIDPRSVCDFEALRKAANARGNRSQAILRILPAAQEIAPFVAEGFLLEAPGQRKSYVVVRSLEIEWTERASARLGEAFDLSKAEIEVARLFYQHRSLEQVALERGVSLHTVRTQMKTIQSKVEAPSQADLIRLLAMFASRAIIGRRGDASGWRDPLGREEQIRFPDGRAVAWTWMGAEDGAPAVILRGFPMGYLLPEDAEKRLKDEGIKLYALSRPGFGNSTLHTDIPVLEDNLIALRILLDSEISGPCVGIGLSNGLVPLLAEQHANPHRFNALIAISYTVALDQSGISRMPLIQRTMVRMADYAPWVVEVMAKSGHRMMQQHGVDWYLERAYRGRPRDMATYADPNMVPLLRNACAHLLMQGHTTFVRELQLSLSSIDEALDALGVPFHWIAPMDDGIYDSAQYRKVAARNANISIEAVPEAGELVVYQKTDLVIDRIIRAVRGELGDSKDVMRQRG